MAEQQNPPNEPQKQFDNENGQEAVNIGNQLKQTYKEAAERAAGMRYAFEDASNSAKNLQKSVKDTVFGKQLETSIKFFNEETANIGKRFKGYSKLIENAAKSSKGLGNVTQEIKDITDDIANLQVASNAANEAFESAQKQVALQKRKVQEGQLDISKQEQEVRSATNKLDKETITLRSQANDLAYAQQEAIIALNQLEAARLSGTQKDIDAAEALVARVQEEKSALKEKVDLQKSAVSEAQGDLSVSSEKLSDLQSQNDINKANLATLEDQTKEVGKFAESMADTVQNAEAFKQELQGVADQAEDLNKATSLFGTAARLANASFLKSLPVFGELGNAFSKAEEAARQVHIETDGAATAAHTMKVAFDALAGIGALAVFAKLVSSLMQASDMASEIGMQINISKENAGGLLKQYKNQIALQGQSYTSLKDFIAAQTELNQLLGTSAAITADQGNAFSYMTERLGVAGSSAAALLKYSSAIGMNAQDFSEELVGQVQLFNMQNDQVISYSEVMEDIAKTSAATRLTLSKFPGGITRAALQARNLGLTLDDIVGASESFLDFESSIQAELEAELLTGKQLNLEQARLAALKGDTAKVAEEIAKQNISAADFANMNVVQQEALAKAVGLTKDKLAESLENQEAQAAAAEATKQQLGAVFAEAQKSLGKEDLEIDGEKVSGIAQLQKALETTDDLAANQEILNKLTEAGATEALDSIYTAQKEKIKEAVMAEEGLTAAQKRAKIEDKTRELTRKFGASQKAIDDKNVSNREKLANIGEKITDAFVNLAVAFEPVIDRVIEWVDSLANGVAFTGSILDNLKETVGNSVIGKLLNLGQPELDAQGNAVAPTEEQNTGADVAAKVATAGAGIYATYKLFQKAKGLFAGKLGASKSNPMYTKIVDGESSIGKGLSKTLQKFVPKKIKDKIPGPLKKVLGLGDDAASAATKTASQGASAASKAASGAAKTAGNAAKGAGSVAKGAGSVAKAGAGAAKSGGGLFSGLSKGVSKVASFAKGLNPLEAVKGAFKSPLVKGLGKILGPALSAITSFIDISDLIGTAKAQQAEGKSVDYGLLGKNIIQAGAYPFANLALNAIPAFGNVASLVDGVLSGFGLSPIKFLTDNLIDLFPDKAFTTIGEFAAKDDNVKLAKGGIITGEINNATIGEAGAEAVVPLNEFYAKLDAMAAAHKEQIKKLEMINSSIMQGGDVYIDGNKAGTALVLASTKMT